jgi:hypothetical protein
LEYGNQIWKCLGENSVYVMLHWEWKVNLEMFVWQTMPMYMWMLHGKIKSKSGNVWVRRMFMWMLHGNMKCKYWIVSMITMYMWMLHEIMKS